MTTTSWKIGLNGNWNVGADWNLGVPTSGTDVFIQAPGNYTVSVTALANANSIDLNAAGAVLNESASGSLNVAGAFTLNAGKALLHSANTISGGMIENAGILQVANAGALGSAAFTFNGGEFLGLASETIANPIDMRGNVQFAAADATVLDLNGTSPWSIDATNPTSLTFGQGSNDGTIVWHTPAGSSITNTGNYTVEIAKGILQGADSSFEFLFDNASSTTIDAGARIDEAGFDNFFFNLQGAGTIANSGAATSIGVFNGGSFSGVIQDALSLDAGGGTLTLSGANTYTGGTTVDSGAGLQLGIGGTHGSVVGNIADAGTLIYDRSGSITQANTISGAGAVTYEGGGTYTINRAETYSGQTTLSGATVSTNNAAVFGSGNLTIHNGELLATNNITLTLPTIDLDDDTTVAAAHGKTLILDATTSMFFTEDTNSTLTFGLGGNDGAVVVEGNGETVFLALSVDVAAGTLRAGDDSVLSFMLDEVASTTVETGATLDWNGFAGFVGNLEGSGSMIDKSSAAMEVVNGNFSGVIGGVASLEVIDGLVLSGDSTYTKGTTIDGVLSLGAGGTTGSVVGNIVDNGTLFYNHSNAVSVTAAISGSGEVVQMGSGITTMDRAQTYSGGTAITGGELSIDRFQALGSGALLMQGGELLTTGNASIGNSLQMTNAITFAAASGTTLNLNSNPSNGWSLDDSDPGSITFGEGANTGTIVWHTPGSSVISGAGGSTGYVVDVHAGVLKAGDSLFDFLFANANQTTVDSGAQLNVAGFSGEITNLQGTGQVTDTTTAATIEIENGNFAGQLNGALSAQIFGSVTLSGTGNMTGTFTLEGSSHLDLSNAWSQNITYGGTASLVLHTPAQYTGKLGGWASGDTVDLRGVDFTSASFTETYNAATGLLTLSDGTHTQHASFTGGYGLGNFAASSDGVHGTMITFAAIMGAHPDDIHGPVLASEHPAYFELA